MPIETNYGFWTLDLDEKTLNCARSGYSYDIDLMKITDSAKMLDWIMQINAKTWGKGQCVADLVEAFHRIFHPQATICCLGNDKKFDPHSIDFYREPSPLPFTTID